jgi:drug/metabolite transporter (DMT)-like permease
VPDRRSASPPASGREAQPRVSAALTFHPVDLLLLLIGVIWGTNYAIIKKAFNEVDPQAFNAVRMLIASAVFLLMMIAGRYRARRVTVHGGRDELLGDVFHTPATISGREWLAFIAVGVVGQCLYQYTFIGGLARTSVANSSLMLAATPVIVALLSAVLGLERIGKLHWAGTVLSLSGIYLVVGQGFAFGSRGWTGDLLMIAAVLCWAVYNLGSRPLMTRHSPVGVTGLSMIIGTMMYVR